MECIYTDENQTMTLDCSRALWSSDQLHGIYQEPMRAYGDIGFLSDVDFVIEDDDWLYLVEYKNAKIRQAVHPEKFKLASEEKLKHVARKFFDSLHWLFLLGKDKPRKYIYVLEYPNGNSTSRLGIRNALMRCLPFALQRRFSAYGRKLIDDVMVVDIAEWNANSQLGKYPMKESSER